MSQLCSIQNSVNGDPEEVLYLDNGNEQIDKLPQSIYKFKKLKSLRVAMGGLRNIPDEIETFEKLKDLILLSNQIDNLGKGLSKLKKLNKLVLTDNKISDITKICEVDSLRILELGRNNIAKIPDQIGNLINLEKLVLGDIFYKNKITYLPETIRNLKKLTDLSICGGQLNTLPSHLGELENLMSLSVRDSQVNKIEFEFTKLKLLKVLDLSHNNINSLPENINEANSLEEIYLDGNLINNLPGSISQLTNLKYLGLAATGLSHNDIEDWKKILPRTKVVESAGYFTKNFLERDR